MHDQIEKILISQKQIADRVRELAAHHSRSFPAEPQRRRDHHRSNHDWRDDLHERLDPPDSHRHENRADDGQQLPRPKRSIARLADAGQPGRRNPGPARAGGGRYSRQRRHDPHGRPRPARDGAASVKSCVLLRKDRPTAHAVHVDYVGFEIPDKFVVGYGLDFNDYYRNLPDIVTLKGPGQAT